MAMFSRRSVLATTLAGASGFAGCIGDFDDTSPDTSDPDSPPAVDWRTAPLEDVTTGDEFTIASLDDPVVLHTFALWCGSCRTQHEKLAEFHASNQHEAIGIDLNVDENEDTAAIHDHITTHGYTWRFAIPPNTVIRSLVDEFGEAVAVAPISPVIVQCPTGETIIHEDIVTEPDTIAQSVITC